MNHYISMIVLANTVTTVAGGIIALLARRAFRRTRTGPLRLAAVGFGCIIGGAAGGTVGYLFSETLMIGLLIQSVSTAGGVILILYSLYARPHTQTPAQSTG
ncbi:MAG: DUF7521 family protein [Natrialbaceae archaeon]